VKNLIKRQPLGAAAFVLALVALSAALVVPAVGKKKGSGKITTKKIANGAVTNPKLADNAVTSTKIANDAVTNTKIANGAVTSGKLGAGAVLSGNLGKIETVQQNLPVGAPVGSTAALTVPCPAGTTVISGGGAYVVTNPAQDIQIRSSFKEGNGWRVAVVNIGGGAQTYQVDAYCLS
jgi:hypothetical protein